MTTVEMVLAAVEFLIVPFLFYAANYINKMKEEIHKLRQDLNEFRNESAVGDANLKSHLFNCKNFEPRHKID